MRVVALVDLPTYGEGGAYLNGEGSSPGSDISTCYMSNDLWVMGGMSAALPVPHDDDVWPWYIACRPGSDHSHVFQTWDTCNIYLLPQEAADWCDAVVNVGEEVAGPYGGILHLRGLADLLESCPEFELGDPVLVDQPWPKL